MVNNLEFTKEKIDELLNTMTLREISRYFRVKIEKVSKFCKEHHLRTYHQRRSFYTFVCDCCKKEFCRKNPKKNRINKFCSKQCADIFRKKNGPKGITHVQFKRQNVPCNFCNKFVEKIPALIKKHKHHFCSTTCMGHWQSKNTLKGENHPSFNSKKIPCLQCKIEVVLPPSRIKNLKFGAFCSSECHGLWRMINITGTNHPGFKGGHAGDYYYGNDWPLNQYLVRKRDIVCQSCGKTKEAEGKELAVHHRFAYNYYLDSENTSKKFHKCANNPKRLMLVCNSNGCHRKQEIEDEKIINDIAIKSYQMNILLPILDLLFFH